MGRGRRVDPPGRIRHRVAPGDHAAYVALAVGLVFSLAYFLIPADQNVVRNLVIYPGVELAAILAIVYAVHLYRPQAPEAWLLIAAGLTAYWVGDVTWAIYEARGLAPFPSPADAFYLAGYPLIGAALAVAVWRCAASPSTGSRCSTWRA